MLNKYRQIQNYFVHNGKLAQVDKSLILLTS